MKLDDWINQRHLAPDVQASYALRFASVPYASVAIDNFLRPEKLAALQLVFSTQGMFEERRSLWDSATNSEKVVPLEVWEAASPTRRAVASRIFMGPHPNHRLGLGIVAQLKFSEMLHSPALMDFLRAVSGIRPATLTGMVARIMVSGHYNGPHNDTHPDRDLCGVFYASSGWHPSFGGRFRHCGPGPDVVPVEPWPNRLLLFQPRSDCEHDVEAIAPAGADWQRWAYTLWFGTPGAAAC
jgi:hypothetical protein